MNLDTANFISVDGIPFDARLAPDDAIVPEHTFPERRGQTVEMHTEVGASTWFCFSERQNVRIRMTFEAKADNRVPFTPTSETKTIVDIPGSTGQGFFYLVYPRKDGSLLPTCLFLAPGVMRVRTSESSDTVFLGDTPYDWEGDDIVFTGKAGAVRVFADRVVLCMNAGSGNIGYRGHIVEGHGPFEQVIPLHELQPGVHKRAGGYAKTEISVDLGQGIRVYGEGPFTAELDGEVVKIATSGRARVLRISKPSFMTRPMYLIDGQQWMICLTDYPNNGWGSYDHTWLAAFAVPEGEHQLTIKQWEFPPCWERTFEPLIERAVINR